MDEKKPNPIIEALQAAWANRPWQGYAQNPPSMLPQLGIAAGLLHPRLGGAMRDMSMARELAAMPGRSAYEGTMAPVGNQIGATTGIPGGVNVDVKMGPGGGVRAMPDLRRLGPTADTANPANVNNRDQMRAILEALMGGKQ